MSATSTCTNFAIGVDVGTNSLRAGLVDLATGKIEAFFTLPITVFEHHEQSTTYYEQNAEEIWQNCCHVVRQCVKAATDKTGSSNFKIVGLGFDATCSLVAWNIKTNKPVSVSKTGELQRNIILWADHRAIEIAERINASTFFISHNF